MDFFEASQAVVVHCDVNDEEVDDPSAAPLVEENPCLVCGHKAFANFIDISYSTSCTSSTVTPVKKRLKDILGKQWCGKPENQTLCLACYDLVDRFDSLESQLNSIRENITEKFQKTLAKSTNGKTKPPVTPSKKRVRTTKPKKGSTKKPKPEVDSDEDGDDNVFTVEICEGDDSYTAPDDDNDPLAQNDELRQEAMLERHYPINETQEEEPPNPNVYDEHHQLLQRGERIRLGRREVSDTGAEGYLCAYCPQLWVDIGSLHTHVHTIHQPEVVDVTIPAELGLGNTMNCGVEIQNCQEPADNPKPWSCLFCDQAFRARTNMSSHFKDKHTPYKPFSCTDCNESFRKGIDLNRHKLYFCVHRVCTFVPKRRYNKRREFTKSAAVRPKVKPDEILCDQVEVEVAVPVS